MTDELQKTLDELGARVRGEEVDDGGAAIRRLADEASRQLDGGVFQAETGKKES